MSTTTCRECAHCYMEEAHGWEFSAPFESWNVCGACDLVNPDLGHVGSMVRLDGAPCKHFAQRAHPARVHPQRTDRMVRDRTWWTDIEPVQKMQQLPAPIPAQRTMEAFL